MRRVLKGSRISIEGSPLKLYTSIYINIKIVGNLKGRNINSQKISEIPTIFKQKQQMANADCQTNPTDIIIPVISII